VLYVLDGSERTLDSVAFCLPEGFVERARTRWKEAYLTSDHVFPFAIASPFAVVVKYASQQRGWPMTFLLAGVKFFKRRRGRIPN
jgi:hypothetical protein